MGEAGTGENVTAAAQGGECGEGVEFEPLPAGFGVPDIEKRTLNADVQDGEPSCAEACSCEGRAA